MVNIQGSARERSEASNVSLVDLDLDFLELGGANGWAEESTVAFWKGWCNTEDQKEPQG